jgi:phosphate:Na+ symporter
MARFLEARFTSSEEDEGRPRYLDKTVLAVPALALDALEREVHRVGEIAISIVRRLNQAIADFVVQLHRTSMSPENARRLPEILRLARYCEAATDAAAEAVSAGGKGEVSLCKQHQSLHFLVLAKASSWAR